MINKSFIEQFGKIKHSITEDEVTEFIKEWEINHPIIINEKKLFFIGRFGEEYNEFSKYLFTLKPYKTNEEITELVKKSYDKEIENQIESYKILKNEITIPNKIQQKGTQTKENLVFIITITVCIVSFLFSCWIFKAILYKAIIFVGIFVLAFIILYMISMFEKDK